MEDAYMGNWTFTFDLDLATRKEAEKLFDTFVDAAETMGLIVTGSFIENDEEYNNESEEDIDD